MIAFSRTSMVTWSETRAQRERIAAEEARLATPHDVQSARHSCNAERGFASPIVAQRDTARDAGAALRSQQRHRCNPALATSGFSLAHDHTALPPLVSPRVTAKRQYHGAARKNAECSLSRDIGPAIPWIATVPLSATRVIRS